MSTILSSAGYRTKIFAKGKPDRAVLSVWNGQKREAIRTARRLTLARGAGASASVSTAARKAALIYQCHAKVRAGKLVLIGDEL